MKILTIIPARKGSKGVPGKNKRKLGNLPLVEWTIDFASRLPSNFINLVSSDDKDIIKIANKYNFLNFGLRPDELAGDDSQTIDVINHELEKVEKIYNIDAILLLQPTCPFRSMKMFKLVFKDFYKNPSVSYIGIKDVDGNHPYRMKIIEDNQLKNFVDQGFEDMRPRQHLPKVYLRNGSMYLTSADIIKNGSLVSNQQRPVIMNELLSINIDTEVDFFIAERYKDAFIESKDY